jgi:hypothetical protein
VPQKSNQLIKHHARSNTLTLGVVGKMMVFLQVALRSLLMHTNGLEEAAMCLFMVEKWGQPGI